MGAGVANNSPRERNSQGSHDDRAAGLTLDERTELKEKEAYLRERYDPVERQIVN